MNFGQSSVDFPVSDQPTKRNQKNVEGVAIHNYFSAYLADLMLRRSTFQKTLEEQLLETSVMIEASSGLHV
jgi:hypothetical protein